MKRSRLAGLLLLAPLTLLAACGGGTPALSIAANWRKNTTVTGTEGTDERLEYEVTFDSDPQDGFSADYSGTYVTKLTNRMITLNEGQQGGFRFETELKMDVSFSLNGEKSETFHDSVTTWIEMLPVQDKLRPVRSFREVVCNTPLAAPKSIDDCSYLYHYSYSTSYDDALTLATVVYTSYPTGADAENGDPVIETKEYELDGSGTYLDNEEIFLAIRGITPSTSVSFRSVNTVMGGVRQLSFSDVSDTQEPVSFEMDGVPSPEQIDAVSVTVGYSGSRGGMPQTVILAKKTSDTDNTYRCVPLSMSVPVIQSLGTLHYTLRKASFSD